MSLTDVALRKAVAAAKPRKMFDANGLYLIVNSNGSKRWKWKYHFDGKEKTASFGPYPEVSLSEARAKRDEGRAQLRSAIDPMAVRKRDREARLKAAATTFEAIAELLIEQKLQEGRAPSTMKKQHYFLKLLPSSIRTAPIVELHISDVASALRSIASSGRFETAQKVKDFCLQVFRYAAQHGFVEQDLGSSMRRSLPVPNRTHRAAIIDPEQFGELLRDTFRYQGRPLTCYALKLSAHLFQRPGEIRQMEWVELDLEKAVWTIPQHKMKKRRTHAVPLSAQVLAFLREMVAQTGQGRFVLPSNSTLAKPMSENTVNQALRRLGYAKDVMCAHGYRATASSLLQESNLWSSDAISTSLSHIGSDVTRRTYMRSAFWGERIQMHQWWSDYLDSLRTGDAGL